LGVYVTQRRHNDDETMTKRLRLSLTVQWTGVGHCLQAGAPWYPCCRDVILLAVCTLSYSLGAVALLLAGLYAARDLCELNPG